MFVSIDLHSSKPCFSVQFVDTYSIHSFPPPSRRTSNHSHFLKVVLMCVPPSSSIADALIHEDAPLIIFRLHMAIHKRLALFVQPCEPKLTIIIY